MSQTKEIPQEGIGRTRGPGKGSNRRDRTGMAAEKIRYCTLYVKQAERPNS